MQVFHTADTSSAAHKEWNGAQSTGTLQLCSKLYRVVGAQHIRVVGLQLQHIGAIVGQLPTVVATLPHSTQNTAHVSSAAHKEWDGAQSTGFLQLHSE